MIAHNLCYTTHIGKAEADEMDPNDYTRSPNLLNVEDSDGSIPEYAYFVKPHIKKGLLPQILEEILKKRLEAKADLKKATDPFIKTVLDGRQLALKVLLLMEMSMFELLTLLKRFLATLSMDSPEQ